MPRLAGSRSVCSVRAIEALLDVRWRRIDGWYNFIASVLGLNQSTTIISPTGHPRTVYSICRFQNDHFINKIVLFYQ